MKHSSFLSSDEFNERIIEWAREQFLQEIHSNFQRTEQYDGPRVKEHLSTLRMQSPQRLVILARVLPLGVFWETPKAINARGQLKSEEQEAVKKLRADYNEERARNWTQNLENLGRGERPDVKEQFAFATREGNRIQNEIAKEWKWRIARAGPGEWGFITDKKWGRITISLNLAKNMSLSYDLGLANSFGQSVRFHDHYLMALGIGAGDWSIERVEEFRGKFLKAAQFALWHAKEYQEIIFRHWPELQSQSHD